VRKNDPASVERSLMQRFPQGEAYRGPLCVYRPPSGRPSYFRTRAILCQGRPPRNSPTRQPARGDRVDRAGGPKQPRQGSDRQWSGRGAAGEPRDVAAADAGQPPGSRDEQEPQASHLRITDSYNRCVCATGIFARQGCRSDTRSLILTENGRLRKRIPVRTAVLHCVTTCWRKSSTTLRSSSTISERLSLIDAGRPWAPDRPSGDHQDAIRQ
jgi:hypothetical protein